MATMTDIGRRKTKRKNSSGIEGKKEKVSLGHTDRYIEPSE